MLIYVFINLFITQEVDAILSPIAHDELIEEFGDFSNPVLFIQHKIIYPRENVTSVIGSGAGLLKPFELKVKCWLIFGKLSIFLF